MEGKISSQNLIRQVNPEARAANPGLYKAIIVDALGVLSAFSAGYAYKGYLDGTFGIAMVLGAVGIYGTFTVFQAFLDKGLARRFFILFIEIAALLAFFYEIDIRILAVAAGVFLGFIFWGDVNGRLALDNGLQVKFFKAAFPVLKKFTTALVIVFVLLYVSQQDQNKLLISENSFQVFYDWASGLVNRFYPEVNLDSSFGNLAESVARLKLKDDKTFGSLAPANQTVVLERAVGELTAAFGAWVKTTISVSDSTSNVMYKFITGKLTDLRESLGNWFLLGWGIALFFVVRGFGLIFYLVTGVFSFIVYQILLASGFIHITGESRTHEIITY